MAKAPTTYRRYEVRFGSFSEVDARIGEVCFATNSGSGHHSIELKANSESRQNQTTSPRRAGNLKAVQCNLLEGAAGRTISRKSSSLIS